MAAGAEDAPGRNHARREFTPGDPACPGPAPWGHRRGGRHVFLRMSCPGTWRGFIERTSRRGLLGAVDQSIADDLPIEASCGRCGHRAPRIPPSGSRAIPASSLTGSAGGRRAGSAVRLYGSPAIASPSTRSPRTAVMALSCPHCKRRAFRRRPCMECAAPMAAPDRQGRRRAQESMLAPRQPGPRPGSSPERRPCGARQAGAGSVRGNIGGRPRSLL